ncbi:IclR family transcriptional regulator [Bhargavaea cecembensis]|uniref:Glycerol operon regulatory protein n=1 Tax=Bhargavaea cecembensis TaxID=394098 RepID=A0A165H7C6_9BACL|nr:IclR family transcriptional regulator [Bhargavaea cecembensis]KZE38999.1 IclR family transcriptional regulator [Bhargavaea cecembensis]
MTVKVIQSVDRAIDILELFMASKPELSIKEISGKLELSKSTVHGIIKTLEYRGYLQQDPESLKYRLGIKLFELGNVVGNSMDIRKIASPLIRGLVEELSETVHLAVMEREEVVYVEKLEGPRTLTIYSHVGKRAPVHCTGVGKAILAYQSEEQIERMLTSGDLVAHTQHTMTDISVIREHLRTIRENGYAVDDEEIELGLKCVAAPIFDHQGNVTASISCSAPKVRADEVSFAEMVGKIMAAASEISAALGYRSPLVVNL